MDDAQDPERWKDRAALLAVALLTFLAFSPTLSHGFLATWDDGEYVLRNEPIRELSLRTLAWAFTSFHAHAWAPVTWLSYAVDHALWGLDPFGFHLTNVLLHAIDAGLVFALALALLDAAAPGLPRARARAAALLAALVWSVHPLRVESVAWVTERKDVLAALFGLGATLAWLRHARTPPTPARRRGAHAAALGLYALSLGAKPALVTLPLALLLLDWFPLRRLATEGARRVLLEKLPWLALSGAATLATIAAHQDVGLGADWGTPASHALVALRATWEYLRLTAWPAGLGPFHLHPVRVAPGDLAYMLPALAVLAVTGATFWQARRRPALAAGWLGYLVLVAPGLGSAQVSAAAMADRFSYFPAIPLTLLAAGGLAALAGRLPSPAALRAAVAASAAVLAVLLGLTLRQASFWRDDVALWSRAIDLQPHASGRTYYQRAGAHRLRGDWRSALADVDEALAIATAKRYWGIQEIHAERARILVLAGDLEGAVADLTRALQTATGRERGDRLRERAELYRALGRDDLAGADLREAGEAPQPR
jgi:tetratricopeptide (TPR) repeat protein